MKVFAQDQILGPVPPEKLLAYALSLPVTLASIGMPRPDLIDRNIALAHAFTPLPPAERKALTATIAADHKLSLRDFFRDHQDA